MDKYTEAVLIFGSIGILLGICFVFLGYSVMQTDKIQNLFKEDYTPDSIPNSEQEILDNCKDLNLTESAFCLRDNVETFYFFNKTDDDIAKHMTLDEIKELGTDCGGYAYLYSRLAEGLGFEANTNNWEGLKDVYAGHRWATVWSDIDDEYCRIDQLKVTCKERLNE